MKLTAKRHWASPEVIVVTNDDVAFSDGNVVARYNEKHDVLTRTSHKGKRPTMQAVRAAISTVAP